MFGAHELAALISMQHFNLRFSQQELNVQLYDRMADVLRCVARFCQLEAPLEVACLGYQQ